MRGEGSLACATWPAEAVAPCAVAEGGSRSPSRQLRRINFDCENTPSRSLPNEGGASAGGKGRGGAVGKGKGIGASAGVKGRGRLSWWEGVGAH